MNISSDFRTGTEKKLRAIWADLLDASTIKPEDNFLDLGGDSLTAMRCLVSIKEVFGIDLDFELMFSEAATVKELARHIEEARGDSTVKT